MVTIHVQNFGRRLVWAECNNTNRELCTVEHRYVAGKLPPRYPVPAISCVHLGRYGVYIGSVDADNPDYPIVLASNIK